MEFRTIIERDAVLDEIACGDLRVRINRLGAEMISLAKRKDAEWRGFLFRDGEVESPVSGWANHATVMGYFCIVSGMNNPFIVDI